MSDNGLQFVSNEMKKLLITMVLHYLRAVPTIPKATGWPYRPSGELLQDSPDPYLALLSLEQLQFCGALSAQQCF